MFVLLLIVSLTFQSYKLFIMAWELIFFFVCLVFPWKALGTDGLDIPTRIYSNGRRGVDMVWRRVQLYSVFWKTTDCFCLKPYIQNAWLGHSFRR